MKLALQLVVVLNAPTKFRDNLFKFTLYTIIHEVGGTRCHLGRHAPFPTQFVRRGQDDLGHISSTIYPPSVTPKA